MTMNTTSLTRVVASAAAGGQGERMALPGDKRGEQQESAAARLSRELLSDEAIDGLLAEAGDGAVRLTGEGGFLPEMIRRVLERGMAAELTDHLGYDKHGRAGRAGGDELNYRNGSTPKTVATEVGDVELGTPRDRAGAFEPRLVPKGRTRRPDAHLPDARRPDGEPRRRARAGRAPDVRTTT